MGGLSRPALRTARLALEPAAEHDLPLLAALDSDPDVMRFLTGRGLTPEESAERWRPRLARGDDRFGYWIGRTAAGVVGFWCLTRDRQRADRGWLGYRLARPAWGRGLATEGARGVLDHGFGSVGLRVVRAETMAVNTGSRAVMRRLGMRHVDTYVGEWDDPLPGWEQGEVVHEITREEWLHG